MARTRRTYTLEFKAEAIKLVTEQGYSVAEKVFDYMMAAKPVLHAVEAGNDLVAENGCGISCPPEDPAALAEAVLRLRAMTAAEREAMGLRGKEYVMRHHDYRVLANRFLEVLQ